MIPTIKNASFQHCFKDLALEKAIRPKEKEREEEVGEEGGGEERERKEGKRKY